MTVSGAWCIVHDIVSSTLIQLRRSLNCVVMANPVLHPPPLSISVAVQTPAATLTENLTASLCCTHSFITLAVECVVSLEPAAEVADVDPCHRHYGTGHSVGAAAGAELEFFWRSMFADFLVRLTR